MRVQPQVSYARRNDLNIAFQRGGDGPLDVIVVPGYVSQCETAWEEPSLSDFLGRMCAFSRLTIFDRRGTGLSDRTPSDLQPTLEERMEDLTIVMDEIGAERPVLFAWCEGGAMAMKFAASYPEHLSALVLVNSSPRMRWADDYLPGMDDVILDRFLLAMEEEWGSGAGVPLFAPSLADDRRFKAWFARAQRRSSTPGAIAETLRMQFDRDVRDVLPGIQVPTLVMHRVDDLTVSVEHGRYLRDSIPNARYLELEGPDHMFWVGRRDVMIEAIYSFLSETLDLTLRATRRRRDGLGWGWESLTPVEQEIVRLVAEGLTNPQIGDRLFISKRTVQAHLARIFVKLGVNSRSEVASEVVRRTG